jgi:hypothetical protein
MAIIKATVLEVFATTSPSGQVKPRLKLRVSGDPDTHVVSFNNFIYLFNRNVVPGAIITFRDNLRYSNIIGIDYDIPNLKDKKYKISIIPKHCPTCGSSTFLYGRNYWCNNIDCGASYLNRLKLVCTYSWLKDIYDIKAIMRRAKKVPNEIVPYELIDTDFIPKYRQFLKGDNNGMPTSFIKEYYKGMSSDLKWKVTDKLQCLDARIKQDTANTLSQCGEVDFETITKYNARDMMELGINQLDALKIITMLGFDYNKKMIGNILKLQRGNR